MVDTRSNMQLADLNAKPHVEKSLQNLIDCAIDVWSYPLPGSLHNQKLCISQFHEPNHINCEQKKKSEIKKTKILSARNRTTKDHANQIWKHRAIILSLFVRTWILRGLKISQVFCTNIIYLYEHNYCISVHHPRCKNHHKTPLNVTSPIRTTLHTKIHMYTLVHKILPRNPAIWLSLHFLHVYIINTQTRNSAVWISLHFTTFFTCLYYIHANKCCPILHKNITNF